MEHSDLRDWFKTVKVQDDIYLTVEPYFFEGNRCNIWLIKGEIIDVVIDCGLGVLNLREYFLQNNLLSDNKRVVVICTHVHFDHTGGAHHFEEVLIHEKDWRGLRDGQQLETINYVKNDHFMKKPFKTFNASSYRVPPTPCQPIKDEHMINLGEDDELMIKHTPGHSSGSVVVLSNKRKAFFSGDVVYETIDGNLLDWLPTSNVRNYVQTANRLSEWLDENEDFTVYPGHFAILKARQASTILKDYVKKRHGTFSFILPKLLSCLSGFYIMLDGFRNCL